MNKEREFTHKGERYKEDKKNFYKFFPDMVNGKDGGIWVAVGCYVMVGKEMFIDIHGYVSKSPMLKTFKSKSSAKSFCTKNSIENYTIISPTDKPCLPKTNDDELDEIIDCY